MIFYLGQHRLDPGSTHYPWLRPGRWKIAWQKHSGRGSLAVPLYLLPLLFFHREDSEHVLIMVGLMWLQQSVFQSLSLVSPRGTPSRIYRVQWKSALSTTSGLHQYNIMEYTPSHFQSFMNNIFRDMLNQSQCIPMVFLSILKPFFSKTLDMFVKLSIACLRTARMPKLRNANSARMRFHFSAST